MAKFRKKPVVIDAVQWKGGNIGEAEGFLEGNVDRVNVLEPIRIKTLEGITVANVGDYLIKGIQGEFYACKPDIFEQTYERAE